MSTNDELKNETANGTKPVLCEVKKHCCERCNGSGLSPDGKGFSDNPYVCPRCNGSGR